MGVILLGADKEAIGQVGAGLQVAPVNDEGQPLVAFSNRRDGGAGGDLDEVVAVDVDVTDHVDIAVRGGAKGDAGVGAQTDAHRVSIHGGRRRRRRRLDVLHGRESPDGVGGDGVGGGAVGGASLEGHGGTAPLKDLGERAKLQAPGQHPRRKRRRQGVVDGVFDADDDEVGVFAAGVVHVEHGLELDVVGGGENGGGDAAVVVVEGPPKTPIEISLTGSHSRVKARLQQSSVESAKDQDQIDGRRCGPLAKPPKQRLQGAGARGLVAVQAP